MCAPCADTQVKNPEIPEGTGSLTHVLCSFCHLYLNAFFLMDSLFPLKCVP